MLWAFLQSKTQKFKKKFSNIRGKYRVFYYVCNFTNWNRNLYNFLEFVGVLKKITMTKKKQNWLFEIISEKETDKLEFTVVKRATHHATE